ncbi:MAG: isochorismatase family protein [Candidatus Peribacteria bacterium]|jgi:nicotinamidase-related amidase|nr:isochorismatase family protein [Candidatus Peribacteria bacterium]
MKSETALVLIGLQEIRREKNSEYYLRNMEPLIERATYLVQYAREMGYKIIFIQQHENEGPFAPDNELSQRIEDIPLQENDIIIKKYKISSFYETHLVEHLKGIQNIVVAGIPTNLCVRMFVEEAYDREFNLVLIEDICQTYNDKLQDFTLDDLNESRPELDIVRLDQFFV